MAYREVDGAAARDEDARIVARPPVRIGLVVFALLGGAAGALLGWVTYVLAGASGATTVRGALATVFVAALAAAFSGGAVVLAADLARRRVVLTPSGITIVGPFSTRRAPWSDVGAVRIAEAMIVERSARVRVVHATIELRGAAPFVIGLDWSRGSDAIAMLQRGEWSPGATLDAARAPRALAPEESAHASGDARHGRAIRIALRRPLGRLLGGATLVGALGVASVAIGLGASDGADARVALLPWLGLAMIAIAAWLGWVWMRVSARPDFALRIGLSSLTLPAFPIWRQHDRDVRYEDVEGVSIWTVNGQTQLQLRTSAGPVPLPVVWLPPEWPLPRVSARIALRVALRRAGVTDAREVAAVEALGAVPAVERFGAVVGDKKGKPIVRGVVTSREDYEARRAAEGWGERDALIEPSAQALDALARVDRDVGRVC